MNSSKLLQFGETLRYAKKAPADPIHEGFLNFHYFAQGTRDDQRRMILESGINAVQTLSAVDGLRRPAIAIRSSPWKAGSDETPWHDEFDLDHGHIRYFGDHKATTTGPIGSTRGNKALLDAWNRHASTDRTERLEAEPLLVFAGRPQVVDGLIRHKGFVEFCGVAIIERLEYIVQRDPRTGRSFPNIALDLNVISLGENDELDWSWIDDRRDHRLTSAQALENAPAAWKRWVKDGRAALPRIRRRVMSSRVQTKQDQLPLPSSRHDNILRDVYSFFDGRKHAFEYLASMVAGELLGEQGHTYSSGWLTRAGGDGGMDFVGRLDVGIGRGKAPLVVLGQAKCVDPQTGISPDQVARLVARLRRGWVGVYVTTGHFSRQAQVEIVDDEYPVMLVPGLKLAETVDRVTQQSFGGEISLLLEHVASQYQDEITARRPIEILSS